MAAHIEQASIPRSSATFEFVSHFPELHMPFRPVADKDFVNPKEDTCLVDGELVEEIEGGVVRKLTAATIASAVTSCIYIWHGKPGRSDLQAAGGGPVIQDSRFQFRTKLVDASETFIVGTRVAPAILPAANGNYEGVCGWAPVATGEYLGTVVKLEKGGWVRIRFERGYTA